MNNKKYKRGDINSETEMIFSHYKGNGKEQWYSQEAWDNRIQKQKELQLEQSAIFFENSNEGIVITDSKAKIVSTNRAFSKITGYRQNEVIGKNPSILNSGIHDKNFFENMWESLKNHSAWQGEIWNKRKNTIL